MIICQILFIDIRFTYIFSVFYQSLPDTALAIKGFMLDESEQLDSIYLECRHSSIFEILVTMIDDNYT